MLGDRIREVREKAGLTQEELARKLHVSARTIMRLEKGETQRVDINQLREIASSCCVPTAYLVNEEEGTPFSIKEDYNLVSVPLISPEQTACCGSGIAEMDITSMADSFVPLERSKIGTYDPLCPPYAIETEGTSMEGFGIQQGATVYVNPREEISSLDVCLVCYYGRLAIKKVIFKKDGGFELLSSDGEKIIITHDEFENGVFDIRGKIIGSFNIPSHGRF